ncbi:MAG: hypothetical protein ACRDL1_04135 [Solirubrobacterales bacterium]
MSPRGSERVVVCTTGRGPTGRGSELEEKIRITPRKGQLKKTVMSLGPGDDRFASIPDLEPGDLLEVTAEIGVTTDSSAPYYRKRYDFDPIVCGSLLLASNKTATEPDDRRALSLCSPWEGPCLADAIPVDKSMRTVVYSVPLDDLAKGDQLTFEARMTTRHPAYPARVSTRVLLADDQAQTDVGGSAKALTDFKGEVGEHNGFNGSGGRFRTQRVGVLRIKKPASRAYLNLVADSGDPFGGVTRATC